MKLDHEDELQRIKSEKPVPVLVDHQAIKVMKESYEATQKLLNLEQNTNKRL